MRRRWEPYHVNKMPPNQRSTGHRLKSANNKTTAMFAALKSERRVILSGTPIQNDLSEFHAMVSRDIDVFNQSISYDV